MFALADLKMNRLLDTFDEWALTSGRDGEFGAARALRADPRAGSRRGCSSTCAAARSARSSGPPASGPTTAGSTCPVVDEKGQLRHDGGVVDSPGLYALGLPVLRRRKSTFIYGIEDDAREVTAHLAGYLAGRTDR